MDVEIDQLWRDEATREVGWVVEVKRTSSTVGQPLTHVHVRLASSGMPATFEESTFKRTWVRFAAGEILHIRSHPLDPPPPKDRLTLCGQKDLSGLRTGADAIEALEQSKAVKMPICPACMTEDRRIDVIAWHAVAPRTS